LIYNLLIFSCSTEAGTYSIKAVLAGHDDYTEDDIEVNAGELTEVDFDMEPAT